MWSRTGRRILSNAKVGVPDEVHFATKTQIALQQLRTLLEAPPIARLGQTAAAKGQAQNVCCDTASLEDCADIDRHPHQLHLPLAIELFHHHCDLFAHRVDRDASAHCIVGYFHTAG